MCVGRCSFPLESCVRAQGYPSLSPFLSPSPSLPYTQVIRPIEASESWIMIDRRSREYHIREPPRWPPNLKRTLFTSRHACLAKPLNACCNVRAFPSGDQPQQLISTIIKNLIMHPSTNHAIFELPSYIRCFFLLSPDFRTSHPILGPHT